MNNNNNIDEIKIPQWHDFYINSDKLVLHFLSIKELNNIINSSYKNSYKADNKFNSIKVVLVEGDKLSYMFDPNCEVELKDYFNMNNIHNNNKLGDKTYLMNLFEAEDIILDKNCKNSNKHLLNYKTNNSLDKIKNKFDNIKIKEKNMFKYKVLKVKLYPVLELIRIIQNELIIQLKATIYFISENHKFYISRCNQIKSHLVHLTNLLDSNIRHIEKLKYIKSHYKDNIKKSNNYVSSSMNSSSIYDKISGSNIYMSNESSYYEDDLQIPLLENNYNSLVYRKERIIEYYNIYELALKELHKEVLFMNKFISYNNVEVNKFIKLYNSQLDTLYNNLVKSEYYQDIVNEEDLNNSNNTNNIKLMMKKLLEDINYAKKIKDEFNLEKLAYKTEDIKSNLEVVFEDNYKSKYNNNSNDALQVLKSNSEITLFTNFQIFTFGLLLGVILVVSITQIYIGTILGFKLEYNINFKCVFPMFRGFFLICLFLWVLGYNVYVWNNNFINYRLAFRFTDTTSSLYQILNRASLLSLISMIAFVCYILSRTNSNQILTVFRWFHDHTDYYMTKKYNIFNDLFPILCYSILFIYLLFPSNKSSNILNYKGRIYFLKLLLECILSPFYLVIDIIKYLFFNTLYINNVNNNTNNSTYISSYIAYLFIITQNTNEFKHVWLADQLTSFMGPIRDLEYTMCYIIHYNTDVVVKEQHCNPERYIVLFVGILPNIIRVFQCLRSILHARAFFPQIINVGKYFFAIFAACLAFFYRKNDNLFLYWMIIAVISTFYSSYWDIKYDFGFLETNSKNYPLRDKLSYPSTYIYYLIIFINFILRFGWMLTTSPELLKYLIYPEFGALFIYFLELFRRGIWNFIRVEYEHIKTCYDFKVSIDVELPLKIIKDEKSGKYHLYDFNEQFDIDINKKLSSKFIVKVINSIKMILYQYKMNVILKNLIR